jgi:hypothetical protein
VKAAAAAAAGRATSRTRGRGRAEGHGTRVPAQQQPHGSASGATVARGPRSSRRSLHSSCGGVVCGLLARVLACQPAHPGPRAPGGVGAPGPAHRPRHAPPGLQRQSQRRHAVAVALGPPPPIPAAWGHAHLDAGVRGARLPRFGRPAWRQTLRGCGSSVPSLAACATRTALRSHGSSERALAAAFRGLPGGGRDPRAAGHGQPCTAGAGAPRPGSTPGSLLRPPLPLVRPGFWFKFRTICICAYAARLRGMGMPACERCRIASEPARAVLPKAGRQTRGPGRCSHAAACYCELASSPDDACAFACTNHGEPGAAARCRLRNRTCRALCITQWLGQTTLTHSPGGRIPETSLPRLGRTQRQCHSCSVADMPPAVTRQQGIVASAREARWWTRRGRYEVN